MTISGSSMSETSTAVNGDPGELGAAPQADILVDAVRIRNFRSLASFDIGLSPEITYLVGENNAGKSSFLHALATACGTRRATADDLYRSPDGTTAEESWIDFLIVSIVLATYRT